MKKQRFHDFDAFASSINGVESKMLLRNSRRDSWDLCRVDLSDVPVQTGELGSGNIAQGELHANGYLLYMPLTEGCEYRANGEEIQRDAFAILESGCEFCISTEVPHDWYAVTVPAHMFANDRHVDDPSSSRVKATVRVTRPNQMVSRQFRGMVSQIVDIAAQCSDFEASPAATSARAELLQVVSLAAGLTRADAPKRGRSTLPREEIIRRAMEYLEQRVGERVLVGDMAAAADVSERTLRTAFNEYLGVGPVRYLQIRQLHRIRRALLDADAESVLVSSVFVAHGEWEFSRFAARYLRQFGELPSATLRRKRR